MGYMTRRKPRIPITEIARFYGRERDIHPTDIILEWEHDKSQADEEQ